MVQIETEPAVLRPSIHTETSEATVVYLQLPCAERTTCDENARLPAYF